MAFRQCSAHCLELMWTHILVDMHFPDLGHSDEVETASPCTGLIAVLAPCHHRRALRNA